MKRSTKYCGAVLAVMVLGLFAWTGQAGAAENFPTKPVTLVIPVGAGGSHDLTARALASVAPQHLGQPLIIELKPGGGGAIGEDYVAKSKPDGYTLVFGGPGWSSTLPAVEGRSHGPDTLMAVARINYGTVVWTVNPAKTWKNLKDMVEWAKANPGKLIHATTGPWGASDLPMKQMMKEYGFTANLVPYDGGGPALVAALGGHADSLINPLPQMLPHIRAGKLRPIAILDNERDSDLPDVPTAKEQGFNVEYSLWRAVLAPKGTPRPIIEKLASAFKQMTEDKSFQALIKQLGDDVPYLGPDEFEKVWRAEYESDKELGKFYKK
jgi:tripartite-type tricarboxylate transporter receptor subunit TctC